MPRPRKCRRVCQLPGAPEFVPVDGAEDAQPIVLTVDEFEAIRLIDGENYSQEQCGGCMCIARATVQQIVDSAHRKIALALVEGRPLKISGGEYCLCAEDAPCCEHCRAGNTVRGKGGIAMKIVVAAMGNEVAGHFGYCENFRIYEIEGKTIVHEESIPNPGHRPGFLPNFLGDLGASVVIAGGMGENAAGIFAHRKIETILGAKGDARTAVEAYLRGELHSDASACHRHEHGHEHGHEHERQE